MVTLFATVLAASACDDSGGPAAAGDPTSVTVLLTDAPGDVVHAWVDIGEVYLQGGNGEEEDAGGRVILFTGPSGPVDLIELIDDVEELATVVIPAGRYGQLRIVLEGAAIEPGARPPRRRGDPRARFRRREKLREGGGDVWPLDRDARDQAVRRSGRRRRLIVRRAPTVGVLDFSGGRKRHRAIRRAGSPRARPSRALRAAGPPDALPRPPTLSRSRLPARTRRAPG